MGGPKGDLTKELHDEIVTLLKLPLSIADSARRVGKDPETLRRWRRRGKIQEEVIRRGEKQTAAAARAELPYVLFWRDTEQARLFRKQIALGVVKDIMTDLDADPRVRLTAATWYLERHHPDEFGRSTRAADAPREDEEVGDEDTDREEVIRLLDEVTERRDRKKKTG